MRNVPIDLYFRWYGTERQGAGDALLAEAAAYTIQKYKPNLLAIHVLVTDEAQHKYGPHHYMASAALSMADYCVGIFVGRSTEGRHRSGILHLSLQPITGFTAYIRKSTFVRYLKKPGSSIRSDCTAAAGRWRWN